MPGYKKEFTNYNPEPTLTHFVANGIANGWINVEDDDHMLYYMKAKRSVHAHVFNNKVQNWLILYLQDQKHN